MKKILLLVFILFLGVNLFAFDFSFDFGPHRPLFSPYETDKYSPKNKIAVIYQTYSSKNGEYIRFEEVESTGEVEKDYLKNTYKKGKDDLFLNLQLGLSISAFRFTFDKYLRLDLTCQAGTNILLYFLNGNKLVGHDGFYFLGLEAEAFSHYLIKCGFRHYSGHYGDESIERVLIPHYNSYPELSAGVSSPVEYVRDNIELGLGYSNKDFPYLSGAMSLILPLKDGYLEPFVHRPDYQKSGGATNEERNPYLNSIRGNYGNDYHALIIQTEIKGTLPLPVGEVYLTLGAKFHEDGRTKHTLDPSDDDKKWESEFTSLLGYKITGKTGQSVSIEFSYHIGRFPMLNSYWKRSRYVEFGIRIN